MKTRKRYASQLLVRVVDETSFRSQTHLSQMRGAVSVNRSWQVGHRLKVLRPWLKMLGREWWNQN